jgi:hypothetical protein
MMPLSCAAWSASATCRAQRLVQRQAGALLRQPIRQRLAVDQLHHEEPHCRLPWDCRRGCLLEAMNRGDVRMIQRREQLRFAVESRRTLGIARETLGNDFQGYVATELRVAGAIDLAHAAGAERGVNFVRTEACAWDQGHDLGTRRIIPEQEPRTAPGRDVADSATSRV